MTAIVRYIEKAGLGGVFDDSATKVMGEAAWKDLQQGAVLPVGAANGKPAVRSSARAEDGNFLAFKLRFNLRGRYD